MPVGADVDIRRTRDGMVALIAGRTIGRVQTRYFRLIESEAGLRAKVESVDGRNVGVAPLGMKRLSQWNLRAEEDVKIS